MKNFFLGLLSVVLCLIVTGCVTISISLNPWSLNFDAQEVVFDEDVQKIFDDANKNYDEYNLIPIALLGEQIVAGTNYMYLAATDDDGLLEYKTVVVYKDLSGNVKITNVNDFDVLDYVNKDISIEYVTLSGGWQTILPNTEVPFNANIKPYFDQATEQIIGVTYYPISVLATQEAKGTNYAILCYGGVADLDASTGVYILTMNVDPNNNAKIVSIAAIDIKEYND